MRAYEFVLFESLEGKKQHILSTQANSIFKVAQSDPVLSKEIDNLRRQNIDEADIKKTIALAVIDRAAETDPTDNNQKRYMLWIIRQFTKQGLPFEEIVNGPNGQLYKDIEYFDALTPQQRDADDISRDINTYNYTTLHDAIAESQNTTDDQFKPEPLNYEHIEEMKVLYHGRLGKLIVPESYEASCELGSGTTWCTASRESREDFDDYNEQGPLYVWIPSLSKQVQRDRSISRKFQFHFPSDNMTDEADRRLKPDEINYFRISHPVLSKIFQEEEANISQDAELAYEFVKNVIKGRWPAAEETIAQDAGYAYEYARDVIKGRWTDPEFGIDTEIAKTAEKTIAQDVMIAYYYAKVVIKGRWTDPKFGIDAEIAKTAETTIAQDVMIAYYYAKVVIKGRWTDPKFGIDAEIAKTAETTIAQSAGYAYRYAVDVIKDRWPEAEETIAKNAEYAYEYARDVIKDRWPEGEPAIARSNLSFKSRYASLLVNKGYIKNIEDFQ